VIFICNNTSDENKKGVGSRELASIPQSERKTPISSQVWGEGGLGFEAFVVNKNTFQATIRLKRKLKRSNFAPLRETAVIYWWSQNLAR